MTGGRGSAASDLYSLGILAFQCLTGRVPFRGRAVEVAEAHRNWPLPPLPAGLPAEVARLVTDLTAKDPADRPGSAEDAARRAAGLRDELALQTPAGAAAVPGGADGGPAAADGRGGPDQGTPAGRGCGQAAAPPLVSGAGGDRGGRRGGLGRGYPARSRPAAGRPASGRAPTWWMSTPRRCAASRSRRRPTGFGIKG